MREFFTYILKGLSYFIQEFVGQIVAAIIVLSALFSWFYFSSAYAAIPVVLAGLLLWGLAGRALAKLKRQEPRKPNNPRQ